MAQYTVTAEVAQLVEWGAQSQIDFLVRARHIQDMGSDVWIAWGRQGQDALLAVYRREEAKAARITREADNLATGRAAGWVAPTEKQLAYAATLGVTITQGMSRRDVSAAIDAAKSAPRYYGRRDVVPDMLGLTSSAPAGTCHYCGIALDRDGCPSGCM